MNKIRKYLTASVLFLLGGNIIMAKSDNHLEITKKEELKYIKADPEH